jgi:hydrogenase maturation factor HypE
MGLAAVSPVRGAFAAATVSIRGVFARASDTRALLGGFVWLEATLVDVGEVNSVSVVVDVDKLLEDDGNFGAEKVLDTVDTTESCELGSSGLWIVVVLACCVVLSASGGAIDK